MLHSMASNLGLHCLPVTLQEVSRIKWVKNMHMILYSVDLRSGDVSSGLIQGSHRLEKYLKMKGSLEKSLKTKFVLKSP